MKVYSLNAFGKNLKGGNPAGVVLDSDDLNNDQMLKIAQKLGFSKQPL